MHKYSAFSDTYNCHFPAPSRNSPFLLDPGVGAFLQDLRDFPDMSQVSQHRNNKIIYLYYERF